MATAVWRSLTPEARASTLRSPGSGVQWQGPQGRTSVTKGAPGQRLTLTAAALQLSSHRAASRKGGSTGCARAYLHARPAPPREALEKLANLASHHITSRHAIWVYKGRMQRRRRGGNSRRETRGSGNAERQGLGIKTGMEWERVKGGYGRTRDGGNMRRGRGRGKTNNWNPHELHLQTTTVTRAASRQGRGSSGVRR